MIIHKNIITMKKILFVLFVALLSSSAFAGPIKYLKGKGKAKSIMKENVIMNVEFDWTNAKFDEDKELVDFWGEKYERIKKSCENDFISGFNEETKGISMEKGSAEAKYKCVLVVENLDRTFNPMSWVPVYEGKLWGHFTIISLETNEVLVEVAIDEAEEGYDMVPDDCFAKVFHELAEEEISRLK